MTSGARIQTTKEMGKIWKSRTGIQNELIQECQPTDRIFKIVKNDRHFFSIFKEAEIMNLIKENNCLHEIIFTYPRRVYFDVDIKKGEEFNLFSFLHLIRVYVSSDDINVYGYKTDDAESYHLTLSNTYFENDEERLKFKEYLIFLKSKLPNDFGICDKSDSILDTKVYSTTQAFKCIYQSKPNGPVHREIKGCKIKDIKNTFITCFIGTERLPLFGNCGSQSLFKEFQIVGPVAVNKSLPFTKTTEDNKPVIQSLVLPQVSREEIETANGLLKLCPVVGTDNYDLGHSHRFKVLNFCFWNGLTFDDFTKWFKNQSTDKETIQRRLDKLKFSWNNSFTDEQFKISLNSFKKYLGNFYPEMATSDDIQTSRFLSSFNIFKSNMTTLYDTKGEFVETSIFDKLKGQRQIYLFNICMGGGKTTATLKFLAERPKNSFIWFAPRQTLVLNISERMTNEFKIKHLKHLAVGANKKKLKEADKLLICNQSLHYLDEKQPFDFVVIDEIESVLNSWSDSTTHGEHMNANFIQFCRLLTQAKKIILLDAFITTKTYNFLKSLLNYNVSDCLTIYSNKTPPYKKFIQNNEYNALIEKIVSEIREGKKLYIFYAFKTSKTTRDGILDLDYRIKRRIQELDEAEATSDAEKIKILKVDTKNYKNSLVYFAESKEKNDLGDVNEKWTNSDYIITNTSITVGVNYEGTDYDKIYLLCSGSTGSPRDIIQTSMRIRKTKEDIIELFFFDVINKDFLKYPTLYSETDNQVFRSLIIDVYAEYHADFVDSFKMFCKRTNYNFDDVPILKNKERVKQLDFINDLYESNMLIEYSKIPVLDEATKELYENRVFDRRASLLERLAIDRYYFDNRYHYLMKESRQLLWNFRGRDFLNGMNNEIIENIKIDNEVVNLEDIDLDKVKVSEKTLELIKKNFSSTIDNKLQAKIINKAINSILGINAVDSKKMKTGRARGYCFTDLFNTLNNIYKEHMTHKNKMEEERRLYNEMMASSVFLEDDAQEIEEVEHKRLDASNPDYTRFLKLKQEKKKIPKELKIYDLDL